MAGTTEDAADYLTRTSMKSLIEWLTAETILCRPEDPVSFMRDCLSAKLEKRGAAGFRAEDATEYVKECYAEASASADEHGRIYGRAVSSSSGANAANSSDGELSERLQLLERIITASRAIAMKLDPFEATQSIIREACRILNSDRATLFTLDHAMNELVLMVAQGAKSLRLPIGQGISGTVAATGQTINIPDAYADARFDPQHDTETGYRTNTILCTPVTDGEGRTVGVLQVINKMQGPFSEVDEEVIGILAAQAGIALTNAELFQETERSREKVRSLLDIIRAMHSNMGINSLMFTITQRAHSLVDADRGTLFLVDQASQELWAMQGEVNIRIPMNRGIAGAVATTGEIVNIPDAYLDARFNQDVDKKSGYRTRTILCMPISGTDNNVIGVIQLINKRSSIFNDDDIEVMQTFLQIAGPILENSQLFQRSAEVSGTEFSGKTRSQRSRAPSSVDSVAEGDEDEDEEEA